MSISLQLRNSKGCAELETLNCTRFIFLLTFFFLCASQSFVLVANMYDRCINIPRRFSKRGNKSSFQFYGKEKF